MSDWEAEVDEIQTTNNKEKKEEAADDDWENEVNDIQVNTAKIELDKEEEVIIKEEKKPYVAPVRQEKKDELDELEEKWRAKHQKKIDEEIEAIKLMEGLDEDTKREKLIELERLRDAQLVEDDEEQGQNEEKTKSINYDVSKQTLSVEKDFINMAMKIAGKLKAEKKQKLFLTFLKKVNLMISKDFNTDLHSDLLESIKLIKNKKKKEVKTDKDKPISKPVNNTNRRMDMDVNVEINPDYKPRNHQMYDDFM